MTYGLRLRNTRIKLGFSQKDFAENLSTTQATVSRYEKNLRMPDADFLEKLSFLYHLNINWLLTGGGEMFLSSPGEAPKAPEPKKTCDTILEDAFKEKNDFFINRAVYRKELEPVKELPDYDPEFDKNFIYMPVASEISAGIPCPAWEHEPLTYIPMSRAVLPDPENVFCFLVNGDSMSPEIKHGDYVIIDKKYNPNAINHRIIAVRTEDGITLKKLEIDKPTGTYILLPLNKDHRPEILTNKSLILGKIRITLRLY